MRVALLPLGVVQRIASGETIDSLVAVVRELVENSLDAGADVVRVDLDLDADDVSVDDNGCGMSPEDLERCAERNATSKLASVEELARGSFRTLGFRGQGLWAVVHRARAVRVRSLARAGSAEHGWEASYDADGRCASLKPAPAAPGTAVRVRGALSDARLPRARVRHRVQQLIRHTAMCHPHVTWHVSLGGADWFSLYGDSGAAAPRAAHIVEQALMVPADALVEASVEAVGATAAVAVGRGEERVELGGGGDGSGGGTVTCVAARPDRGYHRPHADGAIVAVNGRVVRGELHASLLHAFRRSVPRNRHPLCFVHVRCAGAEVDWNVHPMKTEVRLRRAEMWRDAIQRAVHKALGLGLRDGDGDGSAGPMAPNAASEQLFRRLAAPGALAQRQNDDEEEEQGQQRADAPLLTLRAVAQLYNTYIVAEDGNFGIWIVEQHVAHERALFEQLSAASATAAADAVHLPRPVHVRGAFSAKQVDELRDALGIEMEEFGPGEWLVRRVPAALLRSGPVDERGGEAAAAEEEEEEAQARAADVSMIADLVRHLSLTREFDRMAADAACRAAVKNGRRLSHGEMQRILDAWTRTKMPRTCPHGRPIFRRLDQGELGRHFARRYSVARSADAPPWQC